MKIVIRDTATGEYFAGDRKWTTEVDGAYDFLAAKDAFKFGQESQREELEIVFFYGEGRQARVAVNRYKGG